MNRKIALVAAILLVSYVLRLWLSHEPLLPQRESLSSFPRQVGAWMMTREDVLDESTVEVLRADDYVIRTYQDSSGKAVQLFIAYYATQKAGESMHSPKNCLPGSGWEVVTSDVVSLTPDGDARPVAISRYIVDKSGERALVLYWYQAGGRVIASEYWGKIYMVLDALRTGRRDGGIVRLVVRVPRAGDPSPGLQVGLGLARAVSPILSRYLPD